MPIEIRELIIQAKMDKDKSSDADDILSYDQVDFNGLAAVQDTESEEEEKAEARAMDEEKTEQIIEKCVARIKQWLMEKSQR